MTELALQIGESVVESTGVIVAAMGDEWRVRTSAGTVVARRAASCHLLPREEDLVILAVLETGCAYVLAVLERARADAPALLRFDADVRMEGRNVSVVAEEVLEQCAATVSTTTGRWSLASTTAHLRTHAVDVVSQSFEAALGSAELAANAVKIVAERFTERSKYHFRYVDELERVKAHAVDWLISKAFHLAAENAVIQAADLIKADGKQVHIG